MSAPRAVDDLEVYERVPVEIPGANHDVFVGRGLVGNASSVVRAFGRAESVFVITHAFLDEVATSLRDGLTSHEVEVHVLVIAEGEESKSLTGVSELYRALAARRAHRHDVVVALGGGVVTDVAGFVASTFNRGMPLVNVPTTLLGQVDAAIGGKNGINLEQGKNLVGTIFQPAAVLCDVDLLASLPRPELSSGLAEVVKYGFIAEPSLLDLVESRVAEILEARPGALGEVVARCARIKADIVARDEREQGLRAVLNYGHTFAHALERSAGYGGIRHGEAVALGIMAAAHLARELGWIDGDVVDRHRKLLEACGLPVTASLHFDELASAWDHDKKYERGVRFVLLKQGDGRVLPETGVDAPRAAVERALRRLAG